MVCSILLIKFDYNTYYGYAGPLATMQLHLSTTEEDLSWEGGHVTQTTPHASLALS